MFFEFEMFEMFMYANPSNNFQTFKTLQTFQTLPTFQTMNKDMKKIVSIITMVVLFCALAFNGIGQINRTINTKVVDVLAQAPTRDNEKLNTLLGEVVEMKEEGFALFVAKIVPPGTGDDVAARFVVASLSKYVSQFGKESDKRMVENGLLKAIQGSSNKDVQAFYLTQLYFVATDQSVATLGQFLTDEKLCDATVKVLLAVGTPSAGDAMLKKLEGSQGIAVLALAKAVGEMKIEAANPILIKKMVGADARLQRVILEGVAQIASKESFAFLTDKAAKAKYIYEPTGIVSSLVTYAGRLGAKGDLSLCDKTITTVMTNCKEKSQLQYRAAALSIKAKYWGTEAVPLLLKEFDNADKAYRASVMNLAASTTDVSVTRQWTAKSKTVTGEKRAEIVEMLGRKGCQDLMATFESFLSDPSEEVRIEAINAISKIKVPAAAIVLEDHLIKGLDAAATAKALSRRLDADHLNRLALALDGAPKAAKIEIIRLIGDKAGKTSFNQIVSFTANEDQDISRVAYGALKNISSEEDIPVLLSLLKKSATKERIAAVQQALVNAASGFETEKVAKFVAELSKMNDQGRTLEIFSKLGGREALKQVVDAFGSNDQSIKETAFNALLKWSSADAADALYQICSTNPNYQARAFKGFVELVANSALPGDQKLLQYRKVMQLAAGIEQKLMVITRLGEVKTFHSLIFTANYIDDKELQAAAASAIMQIALPASGKQVGLTGETVKTILSKALGLIKGTESEYDKERVRKYLASMPVEKGYVSMFNGKDLTGWKGLVGNPITRSKMTEKELAAKQIEANAKAVKNWSVKDNSIAFSGAGDNLCSEKQYGDFELVLDWRITKFGDSGIYLRGSPQVQIWDTSRVAVGAQVGSGGLYNNVKYRSTPLTVADNPVGDWNHFYIKMVGDKVTVYLNGVLVVDQVPLENYWDRSLPMFPKEAIELQAHGTDLAFRDIYVKEISDNHYVLPAEEQKEGFVPLFNGINFEGWTGNTVDYEVKNGEIVLNIDNGPSHGNLFTQGEYKDFIVRFEFQLTPGANNGLGIRAPLQGDAAYEAMELQILDDDAPIYAQLQPYQYHGSVYGVIAAKRGSLKPVGEWNFEEVIVTGSSIKIILNGNLITDGDIAAASRNGTLDHKEHPGLNRATGHIGFLGHGSIVKFRNIRVKEL
jgi:HEAT repeat protein